MIKIEILLLFGLVVISFSGPPAHAEVRTKFETKLSLSPKYYPSDIGQGTSQYEIPVALEPTFSAKTEDGLKFKVTPYIYSDPVAPSQRERFTFDATELDLEKKFGSSSLKLGLNQVAWGVTDVFNPLDVASSRRYFDPLNSDKRAIPSLIYSQESGDYRFEALYVPVQLPSILPGENSRWLPHGVTYAGTDRDVTILLPPTLHYHYEDNNEVDGALHHNFGARFEVHKSGLDLSAIFYQGAPTTPSIWLKVVGDGAFPGGNDALKVRPDVGLRPDYYLRRTYGGSAVVTLASSIIRFEAANSERLSANTAYPGWSQSAVVGLEHNISIATSTLTLLLQATYARHETNADNTVTSIDRIFDQSGLLGFRLSTPGEWVYSLATLRDFAAAGTFVQLKIEKKLTDGLTGSFDGEIIDGPDGTALGTYRQNDRIGFGLTLFL